MEKKRKIIIEHFLTNKIIMFDLNVQKHIHLK